MFSIKPCISRFIIIFSSIYLVSCNKPVQKTEPFSFFLHEPCMIINYEQNNTIEGTYLHVQNISILDSTITITVPHNFFITKSNCSQWLIGWGTNIPLFDAGVENLREITGIKNNRIELGKIIRGSGFPEQNERIVFWNKNLSGYTNHSVSPIIAPEIWPEL